LVKQRFDILGLGCTAVDEILYVAEHPKGDAKTEVRRRERHCGGLCATALVAGARLGARCAYAGTLGHDEESRFVLETLEAEGIDVSRVVRRPAAGPVRSVIIVDEGRGTRTIFYDAKRAAGANSKFPPKELILRTRVLIVDRFGLPGMIRAARIARTARIPVIADFESFDRPRFAELFALADHLIVSSDFAARRTGETNPAAAAVRLWREDRAVVIVTNGAEGCWVMSVGRERAQHFPGFRIEAVDTTGCGDVFHGAYAAGLAEGLNLADRVRFASAAAALKAMGRGGQRAIPSRTQLQRFLRLRRGELPAWR
jgi:sulfofructose kinase